MFDLSIEALPRGGTNAGGLRFSPFFGNISSLSSSSTGTQVFSPLLDEIDSLRDPFLTDDDVENRYQRQKEARAALRRGGVAESSTRSEEATLMIEPISDLTTIPSFLLLLICTNEEKLQLIYQDFVCSLSITPRLCTVVRPFRRFIHVNADEGSVPFGNLNFEVLWCGHPGDQSITLQYSLVAKNGDSHLPGASVPMAAVHTVSIIAWSFLSAMIAANIISYRRQQVPLLQITLLIFPLFRTGSAAFRLLVLESLAEHGVQADSVPLIIASLSALDHAIPCIILLILAKGWPLLHQRLRGVLPAIGIVLGFLASELTAVIDTNPLVSLLLRSLALMVLFAALLTIFRSLNNSSTNLQRWVPATRRVTRDELERLRREREEDNEEEAGPSDEEAEEGFDHPGSVPLQRVPSTRNSIHSSRSSSETYDDSVEEEEEEEEGEEERDTVSSDNVNNETVEEEEGETENDDDDDDDDDSSHSDSSNSSSESVEFIESDPGAVMDNQYLQGLYGGYRHILFVFVIGLLLLFLSSVVVFAAAPFISACLRESLELTAYASLCYVFRLVDRSIFEFRCNLAAVRVPQSLEEERQERSLELARNRELIRRLNEVRQGEDEGEDEDSTSDDEEEERDGISE